MIILTVEQLNYSRFLSINRKVLQRYPYKTLNTYNSMVSKVKGESGINLARVVHCSEVVSALKYFQALSRNVPGYSVSLHRNRK